MSRHTPRPRARSASRRSEPTPGSHGRQVSEVGCAEITHSGTSGRCPSQGRKPGSRSRAARRNVDRHVGEAQPDLDPAGIGRDHRPAFRHPLHQRRTGPLGQPGGQFVDDHEPARGPEAAAAESSSVAAPVAGLDGIGRRRIGRQAGEGERCRIGRPERRQQGQRQAVQHRRQRPAAPAPARRAAGQARRSRRPAAGGTEVPRTPSRLPRVRPRPRAGSPRVRSRPADGAACVATRRQVRGAQPRPAGESPRRPAREFATRGRSGSGAATTGLRRLGRRPPRLQGHRRGCQRLPHPSARRDGGRFRRRTQPVLRLQQRIARMRPIRRRSARAARRRAKGRAERLAPSAERPGEDRLGHVVRRPPAQQRCAAASGTVVAAVISSRSRALVEGSRQAGSSPTSGQARSSGTTSSALRCRQRSRASRRSRPARSVVRRQPCRAAARPSRARSGRPARPRGSACVRPARAGSAAPRPTRRGRGSRPAVRDQRAPLQRRLPVGHRAGEAQRQDDAAHADHLVGHREGCAAPARGGVSTRSALDRADAASQPRAAAPREEAGSGSAGGRRRWCPSSYPILLPATPSRDVPGETPFDGAAQHGVAAEQARTQLQPLPAAARGR